MPRVLELFSGTGSVGKCCKELGWDVVSVDMILPADHKCDIMDFDYKQYDKDEFDIVNKINDKTDGDILALMNLRAKDFSNIFK